VLAPELAAHAAARRGLPPLYRAEQHERHRCGHRRAAHGHRDRDQQRRRVKEVRGRPAEHQEYH
jgi:hypothetical protein